MGGRQVFMRKLRTRNLGGFLRRHPHARWAIPVVALVFVAVLPVPWLVARTSNPPGMAWRLDGRLQFDGETIDPKGRWYGLSAGRPPVVAEVVLSWVHPNVEPPRDLTRGSGFSSPAMAEPAAIAIGLLRAGRYVEVTTVVEVSQPTVADLPYWAQIARMNGQPVTSRPEWEDALSGLGEVNEFVTRSGAVYSFTGRDLPYRKVATMGSPVGSSVSLAGWLRFIPHSWYRNLALGRSHGLILALAAYTHASGEDLARDRAIAGTGVIRGDGSITPVGGLEAKARAAHGAGVEVFFYPASQACHGQAIANQLDGPAMAMYPVETLDEAIAVLRHPYTPSPQANCP